MNGLFLFAVIYNGSNIDLVSLSAPGLRCLLTSWSSQSLKLAKGRLLEDHLNADVSAGFQFASSLFLTSHMCFKYIFVTNAPSTSQGGSKVDK